LVGIGDTLPGLVAFQRRQVLADSFSNLVDEVKQPVAVHRHTLAQRFESLLVELLECPSRLRLVHLVEGADAEVDFEFDLLNFAGNLIPFFPRTGQQQQVVEVFNHLGPELVKEKDHILARDRHLFEVDFVF